jgi:hypothetical protein
LGSPAFGGFFYKDFPVQALKSFVLAAEGGGNFLLRLQKDAANFDGQAGGVICGSEFSYTSTRLSLVTKTVTDKNDPSLLDSEN